MKRLHVHLSVTSVSESVKFYRQFFGCAPAVERDDYAKWMLDDPRVNFAISAKGKGPGLDHLGIQVESQEELQEGSERLQSAALKIMDQGETTCCYAKSEKGWLLDPQGIAWETFVTTGSSPVYGIASPP